MSLIWGLTWIAIKTGVDATPPLFFAAIRLLTAGTVLLLIARHRGARVDLTHEVGRVILTALLVNTVAYGLLFWGMQYVPTGVSAVVNLALVPVGLFTLGLVAGEEQFSPRKLLAIVLGIAGLATLFYPKLVAETDDLGLTGMLAIVAGTMSYCGGSVLSRGLLRTRDVVSLSALLALIGGLGLAVLSALLEPIGHATVAAFLTPKVIASWLFLVLGGSVVAFSIYLGLLRDWGPSRAGLYAFVSPVVAVVIGVAVFQERFGIFEVTGSAIMLAAAAFALAENG
jgi:drug/metabolite transporter (DMT)-like permease